MPELTTEAHRLAAIVVLVVTWWITEPIPIPAAAMLGATLAALFGMSTPTTAFARFAEPIIFLFIGSFMLSRGLVTHGVDRRIAASVLAPESAPAQFLSSRLDESVAVIIGVTLLFLMPVDWKQREFTITWKEASTIDWGTMLLLGGGFSLGRMMFDTGLAASIAQGIINISGTQSLWALTTLATLPGVILNAFECNRLWHGARAAGRDGSLRDTDGLHRIRHHSSWALDTGSAVVLSNVCSNFETVPANRHLARRKLQPRPSLLPQWNPPDETAPVQLDRKSLPDRRHSRPIPKCPE
jgi:hypothetical protein